MTNFFYYILTHFTSYRWGWFSEFNNSIGSVSTDSGWITLSWFIFGFMCLIILSNIVYFLKNKTDEKLYIIFIPMCLLYIIINLIIHLLFICLFFSIGSLIVLGSVALLYIIVWAVGITDEEGELEVIGMFGLMMYTEQYAEHISNFIIRRKKLKEKYKEFLNIKYN